MAHERTLVTGALGCLGAWTIKALLDLGEEPVGYDLGGNDARLRLVLTDDELG
jgi:nucleoside-diphosphate-sugar epimerase